MKRLIGLVSLLLISCASQPKKPQPSRTTPSLIRAIRSGDKIAIHTLLDAGVDTQLRHQHRSPIYFAVDSGDKQLVDALLARGFKPTLADADHARDRGFPQLADYLEGRTRTGAQKFFERAVAAGDHAAIDETLTRGADPNASIDDYTTALGLAAEKGDPKVVQRLLAAGADPNRVPAKGRRTPLARALAKSRFAAAAVLLKANARSAPGELYHAVRSDDPEFLTLFFTQTRPRPEDCERQLSEADNADTLAKLLVCGADTEGYYGSLALSRAAAAGDLQRIQLLLSAGSSATPDSLVAAAASGNATVVTTLLTAGAPIKQSAIDAARFGDHPTIVALLEETVRRDAQTLLTTINRPKPEPKPALIDSAGDLVIIKRRSKKGGESKADKPTYKRTPDQKRFALVVGIEDYQRVSNADYAAHDADAVAAHLEAAGWPKRNIITLKGEDATKTGFAKYIEEWLPLNIPEGGTLVLYWSGHGAPDPLSGTAYLVPWDADPRFLKSTAYPLRRLYERLAALKARQVFVFIDACFSGIGGRSVLAKGIRPLVVKVDLPTPPVPRLTTITASGPQEIAGSLEHESHGLFTFHLLDSLNQLASPGEMITVKTLFQRLAPRVTDDARRDNRRQTPHLNGPDDAVLMEPR
ncbi:MAG: hypothetical protein COB53_08540 [Elusimicrobia bacterium]|nr:MAG: hypothetical protein COB53_08540 [Elusimicrobiota bacterium]